ncbi:cellulose 1,4-beta-cellobiosidase [Actinoplanes octamycinicus]|uniref:Glucanase n=1 Tax=Actinoplanes octamycinicus TaxID=135948 RepID=A0A7W7H5X0_9ACTN|nr:glycoside hydrolase family 6 protein [Actinoplanes octamycinicus]MBB4744596.1 cellulose 1,4-beta-cellobiosidase [Actinoplanes octamycinicus]GIE63827.1 glucanase [Actinoplanes octamycinicus]
MRPISPRARALTAAAAVSVVAGAGAVAVATDASAAAGCRVDYSVNQWSTGFTGNVTVTNLGDPISGGWNLTWAFPGNQTITQGWSATITQSGQNVTAVNPSWSASLGTNATANFGFNANYSGTNTAPSTFKLNGVACTGSVPNSPSPSNPGSPSVSTPPSPSASVSTPTDPGVKVDNPYAGVKGYVNPEWKAKADAEPGGSRVSSNPTAVWLDRIAAIEGTDNSSSNGSMGVRDHLDAALAQGAGYIQFVIYNLPGRDCSALASNGELGPDDLPRYKSEYIDPIAAIEGDAKYKNLRIINVVEIDSLPNIVTNTSGNAGGTAMCDTMKANGGYVQGVGYALNKLGAIGNVYNYVDAAHHGWIGWDSNFGPVADIMLQAAKASGSVNNVTGFITNTANYSALQEPYIQPTVTVGGQNIRQSKWLDWNQYSDELTFAQAFRQKLVSIGFNSNIGMLIDTSRNGWGGSARPTKASSSTDVNTYVNESRIDRRLHAGNWCNQAGAGLGERPKAAPASGIDAYVWVKPPGESDGSSSLIPNDEGKGFDRMCDPTYTGNARNGNSMSGALPNAPISGAWFSAQFQQLMANAYPAL